MNKFIGNAGPEADGILLCGPSCIGKSYFHKTHKFYKYHSNQSIEKGKRNSFTYCVHVARSRRIPSLWEALSLLELKTKKAIIVGVPYKIWKERVKKRVLDESRRATRTCLKTALQMYRSRLNNADLSCLVEPYQHSNGIPPAGIDKYKKTYVRWIEELNKYNIPYILVDNRNDYPILDEPSFMTMLQNKSI